MRAPTRYVAMSSPPLASIAKDQLAANLCRFRLHTEHDAAVAQAAFVAFRTVRRNAPIREGADQSSRETCRACRGQRNRDRSGDGESQSGSSNAAPTAAIAGATVPMVPPIGPPRISARFDVSGAGSAALSPSGVAPPELGQIALRAWRPS